MNLRTFIARLFRRFRRFRRAPVDPATQARIVGHIAKTIAVNAPYMAVVENPDLTFSNNQPTITYEQ